MLKQTALSRSVTWRDDYRTVFRKSCALMLVTAFASTLLLQIGFDSYWLPSEGLTVSYWVVGIPFGATWWWLDLRGARDSRLKSQGLEESKGAINSTIMIFGVLAITFFALNISTNRANLLIALPLSIALILLGRGHVRWQVARQRKAGNAMSRTMLGACPIGVKATVQTLRQHPKSRSNSMSVYTPKAFRPLAPSVANVSQPPDVLGKVRRPNVEDVVIARRDRHVQVPVLCASAPLSSAQTRHLSWHLAHKHIRLLRGRGLTDVARLRKHTQRMAGLPLFHVSTPQLAWFRRAGNRTMDVIGASIALIFLLPFMAALAINGQNARRRFRAVHQWTNRPRRNAVQKCSSFVPCTPT
ncbi:exopolysaccharide biosynthesis polyprenyl glycosylphosphotransferase [Kocuria rosea]|nr:exopolysaccharide biosynthesis polyprenyl glycosylphosphotransferase [Kocuria rosea]